MLSPHGDLIERSLRFGFQKSNNKMEYEALIMDFIVNGYVPPNKFEAHKLQIKLARYCMFGENLYRKSLSSFLLKCLGPKAELKVMAEMHESFCGNHSGRCSVARRIAL